MPLLEVIQMSHNFGGLQAVSNYNLQLDPGQITGLDRSQWCRKNNHI